MLSGLLAIKICGVNSSRIDINSPATNGHLWAVYRIEINTHLVFWPITVRNERPAVMCALNERIACSDL